MAQILKEILSGLQNICTDEVKQPVFEAELSPNRLFSVIFRDVLAQEQIILKHP